MDLILTEEISMTTILILATQVPVTNGSDLDEGNRGLLILETKLFSAKVKIWNQALIDDYLLFTYFFKCVIFIYTFLI